jgi:hypothetical protein
LGFQGAQLAAKAGPVERYAGLTRQSMIEAPKSLCEEKVTLVILSVHGRFTPAGFI